MVENEETNFDLMLILCEIYEQIVFKKNIIKTKKSIYQNQLLYCFYIVIQDLNLLHYPIL